MAQIAPPWVKQDVEAPAPATSDKHWEWKPGQSGNPSGRPVGSKNKRTLVAEALEKRAPDVAEVVVDKALEGDMQAARLCLERVQPPKRPEGTRVNFKLDTTLTLTEQATQVINAMSGGEIDVEIGQIFLNALSAFAGLREADQLVARITELEAAQRAGAEAGAVLGKVMQTPTPVEGAA